MTDAETIEDLRRQLAESEAARELLVKQVARLAWESGGGEHVRVLADGAKRPARISENFEAFLAANRRPK
jgi:hypothetical protein